MSESVVTAKVKREGARVLLTVDGQDIYLTAQEAYAVHQAIGSILWECVQPFESYPRNWPAQPLSGAQERKPGVGT